MTFINETISSLIIAIVQGLSEWFPISSSGHIVLFENLLNYNGGLVFNVALHFGTLLAVIVYFYKDLGKIISDFFTGRFDEKKGEQGKIVFLLIIATIPAAIAGLFFKQYFTFVSSLGIVTLSFSVTGIFLLIASFSKNRHKGKEISYLVAFIIGLSQVFALFPGISRSGVTICSGLLLGLKEKQAMKFSFLMSIPIILGANLLEFKHVFQVSMILPILVSFIVGLIAIHLLYTRILTNKRNLGYFALYVLVLAVILALFLLFR